MKRSTLLVLAAALSAGFLATSSAQAQLKIGIVDMQRVFSEYHETKKAEKEINTFKARAKKELEDRGEKRKELMAGYEKLVKLMRDEAISPEVKQQKRPEVVEKGNELKSLEREILEFRRQKERQLAEMVGRTRKGILTEIKEFVEERSKNGEYDLVFDKSGLSSNGIAFLLYSKDAVDFSNEIIVELNKNAPKETTPAAGTPGTEAAPPKAAPPKAAPKVNP